MKQIYAIYGAGGHGREAMPVLEAFLKSKKKLNYENIIFIDDQLKNKTNVNKIKVCTFDKFLKSYKGNSLFCTIAISSFQIRRKLTEKCKQNNIHLFTIQSPNAIIHDNLTIGAGSIISPLSIINPNVVIGESFHLNAYSYVSHDCVIGNFVTFAPCVKCNGNVTIEDNVYIGSGAIIRQGDKSKPLIIGKNSIVGAGSVVLKDIPSNVVVAGNPAKILKKKI